ncbi:MAG: sulfatase-like hydrolase/transferase, partial [Planctomycetota bacterium]
MVNNQRIFSQVIVTFLLAVPAGHLLGMSEPKAKSRPNILYIMTDQQPVSCVAVYGNKVLQTPNLDKLADAGCTFHSAYIAAFPCSPSRASQLSGRYAHNHGIVTNDVLFDEKIPSLGNICKAAGYDTAYFGKWHLGGHVYRLPRGPNPNNPHWGWYYKRVASDKGFKFERIPGGTGEDEPCHG